jgi:hypothetical protein
MIDRMNLLQTVDMGPAKLAPIAVFAFNRLDLLSTTLAALEGCAGFALSPVHVFSDAARENRPDEADEVARVRAWLRSWCARVGAVLHEAPVNKGLHRSIVDGVSRLLTIYETLVVLEDDVVVSRGFLTFMNEALTAYASRPDIVQVSGNLVPLRASLPEIGLLRMPACWGWATWKRAWELYQDDAETLLREMNNADVNAFDFQGAYGNLEALRKNADGTMDTWFIRWYASVFLGKGLTVYPGRSLTRNVGFDGSGTNCEPSRMTRVFSSQRIYDPPAKIDWGAVGTSESPRFAAAVEEFFRWQHHEWTRPTWQERIRARIDIARRAIIRD